MNAEPPPPQLPPPASGLVLIVDDESTIAELLAAVVTDLGYTPRLAFNGRQALALARAHWPLLVITDLMMPVMTGAELIAALRAEATAQHLQLPSVLLLTAGDARAVARVEADAILFKPFELSALEQVLRALLDSSHA